MLFSMLQMDVCQILAFLEQNATVTLMVLGLVAHVLLVTLAMEHPVRTWMRYISGFSLCGNISLTPPIDIVGGFPLR